MINFRLDENCIDELLKFTNGLYPLTEDIAKEICKGEDPVKPCTQVYGIFDNSGGESKLVSIMTATYSIVFPHEDGTKMCHLSGAYTLNSFRHNGYASDLLKAIEKDAKIFFHGDYMCCDSTADGLYLQNGFQKAPDNETRLWKEI